MDAEPRAHVPEHLELPAEPARSEARAAGTAGELASHWEEPASALNSTVELERGAGDEPRPNAWRGPGLLESAFWTVGILPVQILAVCGAMLLLVLLEAWHLGRIPAWSTFDEVVARHATLVLGLPILATGLYAWAVFVIRTPAAARRAVGWHMPLARELLLVTAMVLPVWVLGTQLQTALFRWSPQSQAGLEEMLKALSSTSLPVILLIVAVLPALSEELLFRGFIGRGLTQRWGWWPGVLCTTALFGLAHWNVAQSCAVMPIGIVLHLAYRTTRSLWAPMWGHFLNNAISSVLIAWFPARSEVLDTQLLPLDLIVVAATSLTAVGALMWQTRLDAPARRAFDVGQVGLAFRPATAPPWMWVGGTFCLLTFLALALRTAGI